MSPDTIRTIIGIIGNLLTCGLFISPVPTFWKIFKRKDVEDFSPIPYLATLLNCALWVFYGFVHPNSLLIVTINGFGLVVEFIYIIMFFIYGKHRLSMLGILAVEAVVMGVVILSVLLAEHTVEARSKIIGTLCIYFGTCMYAPQLFLLVQESVMNTESVKYMPPFFLSLAACLNGIDWMIYGLIPYDIFVIIHNGFGALLGLAQLIVYGCYYKSTPKDDDEPKAEMELPTTQPVSRQIMSSWI